MARASALRAAVFGEVVEAPHSQSGGSAARAAGGHLDLLALLGPLLIAVWIAIPYYMHYSRVQQLEAEEGGGGGSTSVELQLDNISEGVSPRRRLQRQRGYWLSISGLYRHQQPQQHREWACWQCRRVL